MDACQREMMLVIGINGEVQAIIVFIDQATIHIGYITLMDEIFEIE